MRINIDDYIKSAGLPYKLTGGEHMRIEIEKDEASKDATVLIIYRDRVVRRKVNQMFNPHWQEDIKKVIREFIVWNFGNKGEEIDI